ncbi:MAG: alpha/beta hydrolase [Microlunatus sp.]|nr:alpha/beta hydrolase [Microlunatus sp.]
MRGVPRRLLASAAALAVAAGVFVTTTPPPADAKSRHDQTSKVEKRRVDSVPTPKLGWYRCYTTARCATVKVPLDYDKPKGAKVELAVLKTPARNQKKKLGTLFVNPGGPGGSGTDIAYYAPYIFSADVLERFDVVGFDPRGVASSDNVRCFPSARQNDPVLDTIYSKAFPYTAKEERAFTKAYTTHAKACSTTGKPLTGAMSTAEAARDMDVLRRAVGDPRLTYVGFSYGSYLGQVYANMFPDRIRALVVDGVLDPRAWAGTRKTAGTPIGDRLRSADGASKALKEILVRCDRAGGARCTFAPGNPVANWELIAQRLKRHPLVEVDPFTGEEYVFGYSDLIGTALGMLYSPYGYEDITDMASDLIILTEPPATGDRRTSSAAAKRTTALKSLIKAQQATKERKRTPLRAKALGFPYDNSLDAFQTVACTDSLNAKNLAAFPALAKASDKRAPYFGRLWLWNLAGCSSPKWTVTDEDAYRGPFTKRTVAPVLIVGNYWDPATNYKGAVAASKLLPNSRLLRSDSWGHTAYGTSDCVTGAVDRYVLTGKVPKAGKVCRGDIQPFTEELEDLSSRKAEQAKKTKKAEKLIPVAPTKPSLR